MSDYDPSDLMPEFAMNQEPRVPLVLVLDVSYSMQGEPIKQLNEGVALFKQEVEKDEVARLRVEVSIITFGGFARSLSLGQDGQSFVTIDDFVPPALEVEGNTPMGEAARLAMKELEARKQEYRSNGIPYYRPWVWLITDGYPTDMEWEAAASEMREAEAKGKLMFFGVGVQGANLDVLQRFSDRTPLKLQGLNFKEMFQWLSNSMKSVSASKVGGDTEGGEKVSLEPPTGWAEIST